VHTQGSGPALLCIHGFPTASWDYRHLWTALTARFSVVAIDLLGFGDSDKPPGHRYRIVEQADLQLAVLAQLGIDAFDVLAHDYGVSVAQELLARQLDGSGANGLRSVCFLNGGLIPELHRPLLVQRLLCSPLGPLVALCLGKSAFERSLRRVFGDHTPPSREELDGYWELFTRAHGRRALPQLIRYMDERREQRTRWVGALTQSKVPLAFICGALDPISGRHLAEHLRLHFPTIDVRLLEHIGHYPQVEDPPAVLAEYLNFRKRKSEAI
jgi:pimeloyl-ACP methyl ester carboxylesterase